MFRARNALAISPPFHHSPIGVPNPGENFLSAHIGAIATIRGRSDEGKPLAGPEQRDPTHFPEYEERDMSAKKIRLGIALLVLGAGVAGAVVWAQTGGTPAPVAPAAKAPALPPPPADQVAATVNGQAIYEI